MLKCDRDLSDLEVSRMRVTYGLLKEHVEAMKKDVDPIDPDKNPLIDPRSVSMNYPEAVYMM